MIDRLRPPLPEASSGSVAKDLVALIEMEREWVDRHGLRIVAAVLLEQDNHPELMERFQRRASSRYTTTSRSSSKLVSSGASCRLRRPTPSSSTP